MWLNGKETELNGRAKTCIAEIRKLAHDKIDPKDGSVIVKKAEWDDYKIHISSVNTFPTGAGLASSAAGLACFVASLADVFAAKEEYEGQFTAIARQGSGSASRSLYGGFVKWIKGEKSDGTDSIAVQIADENVRWFYCSEYGQIVNFLCVVLARDARSYSGCKRQRERHFVHFWNGNQQKN
jgi:diphosphomevalonate decarboxylase